MKRIFLLSLIVGIVGCKDNETGLQKNVLNSAYETCVANLKESLKTPSSLKLGAGIVTSRVASAEVISTAELNKKYKWIGVLFDYEAQNSSGVLLSDTYTCGYIYNSDDDSILKPYALNGKRIINELLLGDIDTNGFSNLMLNKGIKKVVNTGN